jgi:hypothetical protein
LLEWLKEPTKLKKKTNYLMENKMFLHVRTFAWNRSMEMFSKKRLSKHENKNMITYKFEKKKIEEHTRMKNA